MRLSDHKARIVVPRGDRTQGITLYAYEGGVRLVSVVAPLDELEHRGGWGGELSESARRRLVEEVAWRADAWEVALAGADRR